MTTDFLMFIEESWELIVENPWTFIIFGVFLFLMGYAAAWGIHSYFINVKLYNIPEREQLQSKLADMEKEMAELKAALHRQTINDLIHESLRDNTKGETIGDVIIRNK